jgi:hypothetical protein
LTSRTNLINAVAAVAQRYSSHLLLILHMWYFRIFQLPPPCPKDLWCNMILLLFRR